MYTLARNLHYKWRPSALPVTREEDEEKGCDLSFSKGMKRERERRGSRGTARDFGVKEG